MPDKASKRAPGNTLTLTVTVVAVVVVLIAFLVLSYNQLFGSHKEATSAIDAAALQAAKDLTRVAVDSPLGKIALVDDPNPSSGNKYPVIGVNTLLATLRLDALIASKLHNNTIAYLVNQDIRRATAAINELKQRINASRLGESSAFDKDGNVVNMRQNAEDTYNKNAVRLGLKKLSEQPSLLELRLGVIVNDPQHDHTNVPTPNQPGDASDDPDITADNSYTMSSVRYYRAGVDIPVPNLSGKSIRLLALANEVSLVDSIAFEVLNESQLQGSADLSDACASLPMAVQVRAEETIRNITNKENTSTLEVVATAVGGGKVRPCETGTLAVSFPQGFPTNPTGSGSDGLSFNSVKGIMNAVQMEDPSANQPKLNKNESTVWNGGAKGVWFKTSGGLFPSSGSLEQKNFKGLPGREHDNPSLALSFMVYDWLRSLGLRPSPKSVVDALSFDLRNYVASNSAAKNFPAAINPSLIQPAYAQSKQAVASTSGLLLLEDAQGDPRDLTRWQNDPSTYARQEVRMWGYIPADSVLPAETSVIRLSAQGDVQTIDGNPVSDLYDLQDALFMMNVHAVKTLNNAMDILNQEAKEKENRNPLLKAANNSGNGSSDAIVQQMKISIRRDILTAKPRVLHALINACYATEIESAMRSNRKVLTGGGVKKINDRHWIVMNSDFYPPTRAATKEEILGDKPSSTGQDEAAPLRDWCAPISVHEDKPQSALVFYKHSSAPVIGSARSNHPLLLPAEALPGASIPPNNMLKFMFHLGDPNSANGSTVFMHPSTTSPFANVPTGNGQVEYQNTQAIKIKDPSDSRTEVIWQVRARDMHANHYPDSKNSSSVPDPAAAAKYFTNFTTQQSDFNKQWCSPDNNMGCQSLISEWAITCPVVQNPPPPEVETPPPATVPQTPKPQQAAQVHVWSPPPPPPCWATTYQVIGPGAHTVWAFLWLPCRTYNGCGQLISATHS